MKTLGNVKPNFFLIGAPKCGTTALSEYLSLHPSVLFSRPKEPKYFHTDFSSAHRHALTLDEYLQCFDQVKMKTCPAVGEGTVWYLYSEVAISNILDFNPSAKFIAMVRNPIELAHSLHAQLLYGGDEDVESFEVAWRLQEKRTQGERLPGFCRDSKSLQYGAVAKLGEQLERLYDQVSADRVLVIVFDDFKLDTAAAYRQAVEFLELPPNDLRDFPIVNPNRELRYPRAAVVMYLLSSLKRAVGIRRSFGVWRMLSPLISRRRARRDLPPELKREMAEFFRDDVEKLSTVLRRDLTGWLR